MDEDIGYCDNNEIASQLPDDSIAEETNIDNTEDYIDSGLLPPYDNEPVFDLERQDLNPLGIYANSNGFDMPLDDEDTINSVYLSETFSEGDLQNVCNAISDALDWRQIPVYITYDTPNAALNPGLFTRSSFDDALLLNPEYASNCIQKLEGTDIVISDMAHEIGHSMALSLCGNQGTYMNEKLADFISGFASGKLGIDIDVARKWFEWYYDPYGEAGYPSSDERWDAEAAGYYYSFIANSNDLKQSLKDPYFLRLIEAYKNDRADVLNEMAASVTPYEQQGFVEQLNGYSDRFKRRLFGHSISFCGVADEIRMQ